MAPRSYYGNAQAPATRESFAPVYFGGSRDAAGATLVPLEAGAEARADFSMTLQTGHTIGGRITNRMPHSSADVQLSGRDEDLGENRSSLELVTGQFEIQGVLARTGCAYTRRPTGINCSSPNRTWCSMATM